MDGRHLSFLDAPCTACVADLPRVIGIDVCGFRYIVRDLDDAFLRLLHGDGRSVADHHLHGIAVECLHIEEYLSVTSRHHECESLEPFEVLIGAWCEFLRDPDGLLVGGDGVDDDESSVVVAVAVAVVDIAERVEDVVNHLVDVLAARLRLQFT